MHNNQHGIFIKKKQVLELNWVLEKKNILNQSNISVYDIFYKTSIELNAKISRNV